MEKLKTIIPVAGAIAVIGVVTYSLAGYHAPEYKPEDYAIEVNNNINTESVTENTPPALVAEKKTDESAATDGERVASAGDISNIASAPANATYKDGVYRGSAEGFKGPVVVDVTIADGKIADITVVSSSDDPDYFNRAVSVLGAIKTSQSTSVDTVSGATYSSVGLINAVVNALNQATASGSPQPAVTAAATGTTASPAVNSGYFANTSSSAPVVNAPVATGSFNDGKYRGSAQGFNGNIEVEVIVSNDKITGIDVISTNDDPEFFNQAQSVLDAILNRQSTAVDTVSGATYSSTGLINAVNNALRQAVKTPSADIPSSSPASITIADANVADNKSSDNKPSNNSSKSNASVNVKPPVNVKPAQDVTEPDKDVSEDNVKGDLIPGEPDIYPDGTYTVSAYCNRDYVDERFDEYVLSMDITLKDGKIVNIENLVQEGGDKTNERFIEKAVEELIPLILEKGNADDIDTVSGATYSSESILNACLSLFESDQGHF